MPRPPLRNYTETQSFCTTSMRRWIAPMPPCAAHPVVLTTIFKYLPVFVPTQTEYLHPPGRGFTIQVDASQRLGAAAWSCYSDPAPPPNDSRPASDRVRRRPRVNLAPTAANQCNPEQRFELPRSFWIRARQRNLCHGPRAEVPSLPACVCACVHLFDLAG